MSYSSLLVSEMTVRDKKIVLVDPFLWKVRQERYATAWGEGRDLINITQPSDEAWQYSDLKHLYGHLYTPVSKHTGETVDEVHMRMKAACFPDDGRNSLRELNREEMKAYIESVKNKIITEHIEAWDDCVAAMSLWENRHEARHKR